MKDLKGKQAGFTLVELLVVIVIMAALGLIFTNTLVQTLRGQNKVKVINQVKQNGQVVIEKLSNEIRQAERVICVGNYYGGAADTIVTYRAGTYSKFRFKPETGTENGLIKRNNFNLMDGSVPRGVLETTFCGYDDFGTDIIYLTDRDTSTGVSIQFDGSQAVFSLMPEKAGYNDVVNIHFRAESGIKTGSFVETLVEGGGVLFNTSVEVRGAKK